MVESDIAITVLCHYDNDHQAVSRERNNIKLTCSNKNGEGSRNNGKHCSDSISGILLECEHFRKAKEEYGSPYLELE